MGSIILASSPDTYPVLSTTPWGQKRPLSDNHLAWVLSPDSVADAGERMEVGWLGLPPLEILEDLGRFLAFAQVDEDAREIILASVSYMREQSGIRLQEDAAAVYGVSNPQAPASSGWEAVESRNVLQGD